MKKPAMGQKAIDFRLPGVDGKEHSLASFADKKLLVLIFTCNHCPYARAYEDRIIALQKDYADKSVQVIAINPNDDAGYPEDSFDNMIKRAKARGFNFPYLRDETQRTARAYGAEYTPEAYVLNAHRELCYIGRIDDNWQHPEKVHSRDLRNAIESLLNGKPVANPVTHAIGCSVKWKI
jgi:peroxiredoxin